MAKSEKESNEARHIDVFSRACSHYIRARIYIMYLHNTGHDIYTYIYYIYIHRIAIHYFAVTLEKLKTDGCEIFKVLNECSMNNEWRK